PTQLAPRVGVKTSWVAEDPLVTVPGTRRPATNTSTVEASGTSAVSSVTLTWPSAVTSVRDAGCEPTTARSGRRVLPGDSSSRIATNPRGTPAATTPLQWARPPGSGWRPSTSRYSARTKPWGVPPPWTLQYSSLA